MNQFYLAESDESGVKRCAESKQRGTSDTWTGLDSSGSIRTFSGVVQSIESSPDRQQAQRYRITLRP
jgi:uncharacterized protein involved in type VI secretion and phage assembly